MTKSQNNMEATKNRNYTWVEFPDFIVDKNLCLDLSFSLINT